MKPLSIRVRLTAWYSAVLAVTFCLLGVGMLLAMRNSINQAADEELQARFRGLQSLLQRLPQGQSPEELREKFQEYSALNSPTDLLVVSDGQGNLIYQSGAIHLDPKAVGRPGVPGQPTLQTIRAERHSVRTLAAGISLGTGRYAIQLGTPMRNFYEVIEQFQWLMVWGIPAVLILASAGGYWMSRRALRPVDEIIHSALQIGARNLSQRLSVPQTHDELQRLSETLNDMIGRLELAFKKITRFTADASHELRTPIALVRTTAELTLRKRRSEEEYREALGQILAELERTSGLIDNLMTLARSDAGAETLHRSAMDLVPVVREACARGQTLADAKHIVFERKLPPAAVMVQGDSQALRGLFLILIDNAVKYTPPGGRAALSLNQEDHIAIVEISDSGIGIAPEDLPHIFERFYRADKARSREQGGTGLGLSIAQRIAEAHQAAIEVETAPGSGALFRVRIPTANS